VSAERESVIGAVSTLDVLNLSLDLSTDAHVHTGFAAGRDAVGVVVSAADRAGLTALTFADQVGPDSTWIPAYADSVRRAQRRTEVRLRLAVEVEVVRPDGWLALPPDLSDLEVVSVAVSSLPLPAGPAGPREVRAMLLAGELTADQVAEALVTATVHGIGRAARYAPTQLARPLSLLAQAGLDDAVLSQDLIGARRGWSWSPRVTPGTRPRWASGSTSAGSERNGTLPVAASVLSVMPKSPRVGMGEMR
jgi:hypothetical protein